MFTHRVFPDNKDQKAQQRKVKYIDFTMYFSFHFFGNKVGLHEISENTHRVY